MLTTSDFAATAALAGDPARANMLIALMDGRALTAAELAYAAGITPQTASGHLARLTDAGLLSMVRQGRHRYHRLASSNVARMVEAIMSTASEATSARQDRRTATTVVGPRDAALRRARTCYDHLAGQLGVALADALVDAGHLTMTPDGGEVTESGHAFLADFGAAPAPGKRVFCRPCLDWSERRPHIAGRLGAALTTRCLDLGWVSRLRDTRAVAITPAGAAGFRQRFGISLG